MRALENERVTWRPPKHALNWHKIFCGTFHKSLSLNVRDENIATLLHTEPNNPFRWHMFLKLDSMERDKDTNFVL